MTAQHQIDEMIAALPQWQNKIFTALREAVLGADAGIVEEWKWMGSPVWSRDGLIAVADAHKKWVKITFAYGALISDPDKLFNNGFNGNTRRSIDYFEGDSVHTAGLKNLVRAAIVYNQTHLKKNAAPSAKRAPRKKA